MIPKRVLVTGATGGLGQAVVKKLLSHNIHVIGTHSGAPPPPLENVTWLQMDITQAQSVTTGVAKAGDLDGLIHCAGGFRFGPLTELTDADLDFLMDLNLRAPLLLLRAVLPGMKARNHGRIVLVGANSSLHPGAGVACYAATKAGLNAAVQSAAAEVKQHNITINAVLPSIIDTPANRTGMPKADFSSWVTPEQLADVMFALISDVGTAVHGALIPITGRV